MSTMRTKLGCVAPRHRRDLALGMILLSCTKLADGEKIPEPRGTGQMACVELVSKLKTEGATLAPRATHPPGNEAPVHPAGAFPMSGGQWISYHPHHPRWIRNRHVQPRGRPRTSTKPRMNSSTS
jgi:hypothetical protein